MSCMWTMAKQLAAGVLDAYIADAHGMQSLQLTVDLCLWLHLLHVCRCCRTQGAHHRSSSDEMPSAAQALGGMVWF
jgi:hypothetical protein